MATREQLKQALIQADRSGDTRAAELFASQIKQMDAQPAPEPSIGDRIIGGFEGAATVASSLVAEPIAGIAGLAAAANPFAEEGAGARRVEEVREALTYEPQTERGQVAVETLQDTLSPVADALQNLRTTLGDYAYEETDSPALAALAQTLPDAALELLGAGVGRRAATTAATQPQAAQAARTAQAAIDTAEDTTGVRQLTTDALPPETRAGRFMQQQGELIDGSQRAAQQTERVRAVDRLLGQFDVTESARYEADIVQGIKNQVNQRKAKFGETYEATAGQLNELGAVPITKTKQYAQQVLDRQQRLGSLADEGLISDMTSYLEAPDDLSFNEIRNIRSSVGEKLNKVKQGAPVQGSSDLATIKKLYSSLSEDLGDFARTTDESLFNEWKAADAEYKNFATGADKTAVKSVVKRGDATPEIVDTLLFSNKASDVNFLANNLDEAGKQAAKQRVLQRALEKSIDDDTVNPNRFNTQLKKLNSQIDAVFTKEEATAIKALNKVLSQTRRAQDASVATPTGQQVVPIALLAAPQALIPAAIQAVVERPTMRNLLIKRAAAKTSRERQMLDADLMREIDRAGLLSAAATGAATQTTNQNQEVN